MAVAFFMEVLILGGSKKLYQHAIMGKERINTTA